MQLDGAGHPLHTRALTIEVAAAGGDRLHVTGELVDLRKRGFTPVGTEVQGAGIIHQMSLEAEVDAATRTLRTIAARQPVVAFDASPATLGESCRDVTPRLAALAGTRLDEARALRDAMGGPVGCSHLLALGQFLLATVADCAPVPVPEDVVHRRVLRRDLVLDGSERADGTLNVTIQLSDLGTDLAPGGERPMARFRLHDELRLQLTLQGWPATIVAASGAERRRTATAFAGADWHSLAEPLAAVQGVSLGRGGTQALAAAAGSHTRLRAVFQQLVPALIQCRASFPDKWLDVAATAPDHPGLIGMADSCYMWRRGGALERLRG